MKDILVVGAQSRAITFSAYMKYLYPNIKINAYFVDDLKNNPKTIDGIEVLVIDEAKRWDVTTPIYVATRGVNFKAINEHLHEIGMKNIIQVSVELDRELRNAYVKRYFTSNHYEFSTINEISSNIQVGHTVQACIFVATSIYDQKLHTDYEKMVEEKTIQVGAALTDIRIQNVELVDSKGINISQKNRQYCELTAIYWIWKNASEEIVGLAHYRRHFVLPKDWVSRMYSNNIDAILPVPLYVGPNISENYMNRHLSEDWVFLMKYMRTNDPENYEQMEELFNGNLYFPCNMFIVKKEILDEMCTWLFPILDVVVQNGGIKEDVYLNRYPGFISERLITYFFFKNRNRFHIVFAEKGFIS